MAVLTRPDVEPPGPVVYLGEADGAREPSGASRRDMAAIGALMVVLAFLWGRAAGTWFWLDEGIANGIASHPLGDIPALLRQDGAPPLYYLILHGWVSAFGGGDAPTHALSLLFALASVPAAMWAGWSLVGRRTGWMAAILVAASPFVAEYANETRMYSLVVLLTFVVLGAFVRAFIHHRRRYLPVFAGALAALMYTHNWGVLVAAATGLAAAGCVFASGFSPRRVRDAPLTFGAVAVAYAPWVPTLIYQRGQDLQPWAQRPTLVTMRSDIAELFGEPEVFLVLALGAGIGLASLWARRATPPMLAVGSFCAVVAVVAAGGWVSGVWAYRYLAAVLPPLALVAALGLARGGRAAVACLGAVVLVTAPIGVKTPPQEKSNAKAVATSAGAKLIRGDLVISPDLQMVPLLANYLPDGLRYATTAGAVDDPDIVDWRGSMQRLVDGDPTRTLPPLLGTVRPGARVLLACPPTVAGRTLAAGVSRAGTVPATPALPERSGLGVPTGGATGGATGASLTPAPKTSPFHALIHERCGEAAQVVFGEAGFELEAAFYAPPEITRTPVDGFLLRKAR